MASGKGADCGRICKEKGIRGGNEPERSRKGARIRRVPEDKGGRIRHPRKSRVERRWRMQGVSTGT